MVIREHDVMSERSLGTAIITVMPLGPHAAAYRSIAVRSVAHAPQRRRAVAIGLPGSLGSPANDARPRCHVPALIAAAELCLAAQFAALSLRCPSFGFPAQAHRPPSGTASRPDRQRPK